MQDSAERSLKEYDLVALFLDGKTFAADTMVIALGVTLTGEKVVLGFVETSTDLTERTPPQALIPEWRDETRRKATLESLTVGTVYFWYRLKY
jgi:hypothetical protein